MIICILAVIGGLYLISECVDVIGYLLDRPTCKTQAEANEAVRKYMERNP